MAKTSTITRFSSIKTRSYFPDGGEPTWEVAYLFPAQGHWTEDDYFRLESANGDHALVELANGNLEVLPMPTQTHQLVLIYFFKFLEAFTTAHAPGVVLTSSMHIRLGKTKICLPDVVYMKAEHAERRHEEYWDGADLAMEVVSGDPKDRARDLEAKPRDYARAGIAEYWIIDPQEKSIRVLTLVGKAYRVHGEHGPGARATSVLLPGFEVSVDAVFAAAGINTSRSKGKKSG
jgi:Uma2 family endonuclease